MVALKHGSLFSGIGGFDLAAAAAGWDNVFHCDIEAFARRTVKYHFPQSESYGDITKTDFTIWRGRVDVISGGFPCQPYSVSGKRLGKADARHLWPEMLRAIREASPRWVVGENVRGIVSWNKGLVFEEVQADLEALGYKVLPFILPAASVGAPHRRDRVWFVAYAAGFGAGRLRDAGGAQGAHGGDELLGVESGVSLSGGASADANDAGANVGGGDIGNGAAKNGGGGHVQPESGALGGAAADATGRRRGQILYNLERKKSGRQIADPLCKSISWDEFPTQPPLRVGDDGLSARLDGITLSQWRNETIRAAGNAIVPHVAYEIFQTINEYEQRAEFSKSPSAGDAI